MPAPVREVVQCLHAAEGAPVLVGGCVRDVLLGRPLADWDLATCLLPAAVATLFPKVVRAGEKHGTIMVLTQAGPVEVTTFRGEGAYLDGRRPDSVTFLTDVEADLARRDFTINAIAVDPVAGRLIDPFGGVGDLQRGWVRTVGDPAARFGEDGLRTLRAIRFAAVLGFKVAPATAAALAKARVTLAKVAWERRRVELEKSLASRCPLVGPLKLLVASGLIAELAPELAGTPPRTFALLEALPPAPWLRLCGWGVLAKLSATALRTVALRLKLSRLDVELLLTTQAAYAAFPARANAAALRHWLSTWGIEPCHQAALLLSVFAPKQAHALPTRLTRLVRSRPCLSIAQLAVTGDDLVAMGLSGRQVGGGLRALLHVVLERPSRNTRAQLLRLIPNLSTTL